MPYVPPESLRVRRHAQFVTVESPFWTVVHDTARGGVPVDIRFTHGLAGNVLREPLVSTVGERSDANDRDSRLRVRRKGPSIDIEFTGSLTGPGRRHADGIEYRALYEYTPYWVRRELRLRFPRPTRVERLTPLSSVFDDRFTQWAVAPDPRSKRGRSERVIGPHYDQDAADVRNRAAVLFRDPRPPGWVSLYRLGGEGVQVAPCAFLSAWEFGAPDAPRGDFTLRRGRDGGIAMRLDVVAPGRAKVSVPAGEHVFACFITLANLPQSPRAPTRTVMVGNPPFPRNEVLRAWARSGVELIVIMEGASWVTGTDRYWRVGTYPCYRDAADMRDMDRLIRSAHRFGMRVIPYTCPTYLHPEAPVFARSAPAWRQAPRPDSQVIYHPAGKSPGGCYGALMCSDALGWRRYYARHVRTLLTRHKFDGLYLDNVWKAPCYLHGHLDGVAPAGGALHGGLDGTWRLLGDLRRRLGPKRLMVIHNGDSLFQAASNNLADMVVTLEGYSVHNRVRYDLADVGRAVRAFPACAVSVVPCSTWYRVPEPLPKRTGLYDGIAKTLLFGTLPYSYSFWETRWGYRDWRDCLDDPHGIYAAFRKLKAMGLDGMACDDALSGAVRTSHRGVRGARYYRAGREVVLLSNISGRDVRGVRWSCGDFRGIVRRLCADEFAFIDCRPE